MLLLVPDVGGVVRVVKYIVHCALFPLVRVISLSTMSAYYKMFTLANIHVPPTPKNQAGQLDFRTQSVCRIRIVTSAGRIFVLMDSDNPHHDTLSVPTSTSKISNRKIAGRISFFPGRRVNCETYSGFGRLDTIATSSFARVNYQGKKLFQVDKPGDYIIEVTFDDHALPSFTLTRSID